jgi:flagellar biosynthesis chaperone FliJ
MNYEELGGTMEAWRREGTVVAARMEPKHEQATIQQQEYADTSTGLSTGPRAVLDPANEGLTLDQEFNTVIQAFHQEFDTVIRMAFADAMSRAAKIKSKAEAEAEILLQQAHNEKAQLEAEVASLRQKRDRLARTLSQTLLSLEQGLQAMAPALRQAEEQVKQQMQILQEAGLQLEGLRPAVAEELVKPEKKAVEEYGVSEEEAVEEHRMLEASQPVSETQVQIIGLRQISLLHRIEGALAAHPSIEDVRLMKYSEGVLIMAVAHRPTSLVEILKAIPGLSVQDVREVGEWIEVYLGDTFSP